MISIFCVEENGLELAEFKDPRLLDELLKTEVSGSGHCLRFIDNYGDTTFNQLQMPVLVQELRIAANSEPDLRERLESLAAFVESANGVHTYVKFIGD